MNFDIIPEFPPAPVKENAGAIDWGMDNVIAYASGCIVHLCYIVNGKLHRASSIDVSPNPVTSISIHSDQRLIAISDSEGRILIYHVEKQAIIASCRSFLTDKIFKIKWFGEYLVALYNSAHFRCFVYKPGISSDTHHNIQEIWSISLPYSYTTFSIDPHTLNYILFSGTQPKFSVYKIEFPHTKPEPYYEVIELTNPDEITDSQWSYHVPGVIFVITGSEIMCFHMDMKALIPIVQRKTALAQFTKMFQFYNDHSRIMTLHKNGTVTIMETSGSFFKFDIIKEISPKHYKSPIMSLCNSTNTDRYVVFYYSNIGISLMDMQDFVIKSVCPLCPANVTSFDCDGTVYAYGTDHGSIIAGNLFDSADMSRFIVSNNPVIYVSINSTLRIIYFQTSDSIGHIDLSTRRHQVYQSRYGEINSSRCFSSHFGTFIVARDKTALGVFIRNKETPLLLNEEMVDISVDELNSSQESGRFAVLDKNSEIFVYEYDMNSTSSEIRHGRYMLNTKLIDSPGVCICLHGTNFVIAFQNGVFIFMDEKTRMIKKVTTRYTNVKKLKFINDLILGISDNRLFVISMKDEQNVRECPNIIRDFSPIDGNIVLVLSNDKVLRIIKLSDFKPISPTSRFMPLESRSDFYKRRLHNLHAFKEFISEEAKDVHAIIQGKPCLRLQSVIGYTNEVSRKAVNELIDACDIKDKEGHRFKFMHNLFNDNFNYCSSIVQSRFEDFEDKYFENSLLGCLLLTYDRTQPLDEKKMNFIETSAVSLLSFHKFYEGCALFRLFGMDKKGFDSIMEYGQIKLASLFALYTLKGDEHKEALFKLACLTLDMYSLYNAMLLFAAAGEFHPVLDIMFKLGREVDAHFLFLHLSDKGMLHELSHEQMSLVHNVDTLDRVVEKIELKYADISQNFSE